MSDAGDGNAATTESPGAPKGHAAKDRSCPFCHQAFTSSSLGRHLDLYIKEKNPKPADGVHDVDAIRKMRSGITRRQPRGSLAARRDASTPATPTESASIAQKSPDDTQHVSLPKDGQYVVDRSPVSWWQQPGWEATGVINDLPPKKGGGSEDNVDSIRRANIQQQQRVPSRMAQKQQLDTRQRLTDAVDTARAAELALRELISSWRAAKHQIDMNSVPFDFDPLSLDFPALTLQCLQPPPTLFSSTPIPTSTSWSLQPPTQRQYDALVAYFQEEFRKWKVACATATTALQEELTYPPSHNHTPLNGRDSVKKAEEVASNLEKQVNEHLQSTFAAWEQIPSPRQHELWNLELARSAGRRQKEIEALKQSQHTTKQDNTNLRSQIEDLNRLQQPREFKTVAPSTIPIDQNFVAYVLQLGVEHNAKTVGLNLEDRHADVATVVQSAIERWKNVIVSTRGGLGAQRPLDRSIPPQSSVSTPASAPATTVNSAAPTPTPVVTNQPKAPAVSQHTQPRHLSATAGGPHIDSRSAATTLTTSASVAHDEVSDADADAEMEDDDSFAPRTAPVLAKPPPSQPSHKLQISRARENAERNNTQFAINGGGIGNAATNQRLEMARPMAEMSPGGLHPAQRHPSTMAKNDYGTPVQGLSNGESMYIDS